jgi:integrase
LPGLLSTAASRSSRLTPEDLDGLYAHLLSNGRRNKGGGPLSPKTVRLVHNVIHKALADAHRKGSVARNVADVADLADLADPPKISTRTRPKMRVWNAAELRAFLELVEDHDLYAAFYVKANTGMRRGEVLGLTWRIIDFDGARLTVTQTVTAPDYELIISDVKSAHRLRTIHPIRALSRFCTCGGRGSSRRTCRRASGPTTQNSCSLDPTAIHSTPTTSPEHSSDSSPSWTFPGSESTTCATHATLLLKAGVPIKVVSERLGHASVAFTMQVYQHVLPGIQADAAATFSDIVFGT